MRKSFTSCGSPAKTCETPVLDAETRLKIRSHPVSDAESWKLGSKYGAILSQMRKLGSKYGAILSQMRKSSPRTRYADPAK
jgi:hypothetical protein